MNPVPFELAVDAGVILRGLEWAGGPGWALLVHGPGPERDLDDWRGLTADLQGTGAGVLAIDLRGHGASDGHPDPALDAADISRVAALLRGRGAGPVTVIAAGSSGLAALRACESVAIAGVVLLSPPEPGDLVPRGAGAAKLIVASAQAAGGLAAAGRLRAASIGPALLLALPSEAIGTDLLDGAVAATCREHVLAFVRTRALEHTDGGRAAPAADLFLERLGIVPKGVTE